jgi:hypothetical protein
VSKESTGPRLMNRAWGISSGAPIGIQELSSQISARNCFAWALRKTYRSAVAKCEMSMFRKYLHFPCTWPRYQRGLITAFLMVTGTSYLSIAAVLVVGAASMYVMISWIERDGSVRSGVEWPGYFDETGVPVVGDTIVAAFSDGIDACEVVERYIHFVKNNEEVRHLILKRVELKPGREQALHLMKKIEGVNAFTIEQATIESLGLMVPSFAASAED